jgi:rifampin ADP-ribosylating transferase
VEQLLTSARLPDGTFLPYVEQGDRSGVPVVMLHAVAESWRSWSRLLPHLPRDVHAIALTQRGHGEADKPAEGYRLPQAADDVVAFLDALGIGAAVVAGTSSGGLVAQQVAVDHPRRVLGLALVGSPRTLRGARAPGWVSDVAALADPVSPEFARESVDSFPVGRALPRDFVEQMVEDGARTPARVWRAVMQGLLEAPPPTETGTVSAPTLVLWGDQDGVLPREEQDRLVAAIPGARLVVYEGTGHLVLWEEPERVASDLVGLVRSLPPPGPDRLRR